MYSVYELKGTFSENEMDEMVFVCASLVGQYSIDLSDDCWQLSQAEHRGHHPVIVTNLYAGGEMAMKERQKDSTANSTQLSSYTELLISAGMPL